MTHLDTRHDQPFPPQEAYDELKLPRILIVIGAASMVIAFLTLVTSFAGLLMAAGASSTTAGTPAFVPPTIPATMPAVLNPQTTSDSQVPSLGLTQSNRKLIVSKLSAMQKMSDSQTLELRYFLLLTGSSIFPSTTGTITDDDIKFQITGSGKYEGHGEDDPAYVWFMTQNGKLTIFDTGVDLDRGGGRTPIATSYSINATVVPGPAFGALGRPQINAAVRQIKMMWPTPPPLNMAQQTTLIAELKSPSQQLLSTVPNQYPVSTVLVDTNGNTTIVFQGRGQIQIDPQGTTVFKRSAPYIPARYRPPAMAGISQWATTLSLADLPVSACLSLLLLIAGIQTLRGSRSGSLLHCIFAWIKLPLAILGAFAAVALSQEMGQNFDANATLFDWPSVSLAPTIILLVALLSAAYPILLLIVFRMRKIRTFYQHVISG